MKNAKKTEVMILGTLHGIHKDNTFYSYEDIFLIIDNYKPDVIGVEIRKEDILQQREYLIKYYPYEMIEAKFRYENDCKIYGFDWLGDTIEDKLIPDKYFETLDVKILEKQFDSTDGYVKEKKMIEIIDSLRIPLIINHTAEECNNGKYDLLVDVLYNQLEVMFKNTPFENMSNFYRERDKQIDKNFIDIIKNNIGQRIIFLTGIDHKVFAIKAIKEYFKDEIIIKEIYN